ncbi:hypothetical protein K7432_008726 [Basidiobolus ranarum]|uniref:RGS domain-containing protein n=1 Tax=Basidiobolus ranarum TaxID=34480 RepID=A0ABR2VY45_9FUNG
MDISKISDTELLDAILAGKTQPPITFKDFYNYLEVKEKSIENISFCFWRIDYIGKFSRLTLEQQSECPTIDVHKVLHKTSHSITQKGFVSVSIRSEELRSPRIEQHHEDPSMVSDIKLHTNKGLSSTFQNTEKKSSGLEKYAFACTPSEQTLDKRTSAALTQPLRLDLDQALLKYFLPGSSSELNISHETRKQLLSDARITTNPAILESAYQEIHWLIASSSIPNFRKIATANISDATKRQRILWALPVFLLSVGGLIAIILTHQSRWYRIIFCLFLSWSLLRLLVTPFGICLTNQFLGRREILSFEVGRDCHWAYGEDPIINQQRRKLAIRVTLLSFLVTIAIITGIFMIPT